ncbi:STAS domain-containing protein [Streptomyces sp. NPDC051214]|uniref:STAS domain-containing protein n=1 Tax=Streptomyces sp. NPDC051214 TaxID=3155282 RepID=UPI0034155185
MTFPPFTSHAVVDSGHARVTLAGELDFDTAPCVLEAVDSCLAERPTGFCLDLTGISFCDCAGLNSLLTARLSVLQAGVELLVIGVGVQLERLLALIGADGIFTEGSTFTDAEAEAALCASDTTARRRDTEAAADKSLLRDLLA